jgi:hypothetical protein
MVAGSCVKSVILLVLSYSLVGLPIMLVRLFHLTLLFLNSLAKVSLPVVSEVIPSPLRG